MCRNSGDPRTALVSVRALLMQVAYPMVDAGVGRIRRYPEAQTVAVQRLLPLGPPPAWGCTGSSR